MTFAIHYSLGHIFFSATPGRESALVHTSLSGDEAGVTDRQSWDTQKFTSAWGSSGVRRGGAVLVFQQGGGEYDDQDTSRGIRE